MQWWGWIILGTLLLGSELLGVDAAFYLLFVGVAAIMTGLLAVFGVALAPWLQWLVFATLSLIFMVAFRRRIYTMFRGVAGDYPSGPAGEFITLDTALAPGATGRQTFRGTNWTVVNDGAAALSAGSKAKIVRVDSLTLIVTAG